MTQFYCLRFDQLSLQQLYDIMALRQEVFVVEQDCVYLDADGKDQESIHLMAYSEKGQLAAYARIMPKGLRYVNYIAIGRIVSSPAHRGKGIGRLLVQECLTQIRQLFGEQAIKISAQSYLLKFYESFGFQTVGEPYLEDGIPHVAMRLEYRISNKEQGM